MTPVLSIQREVTKVIIFKVEHEEIVIKDVFYCLEFHNTIKRIEKHHKNN